MATPIRNSRHHYLKTLCRQWMEKHYPVAYRILVKRAGEKYPGKVKVEGNGNGQ